MPLRALECACLQVRLPYVLHLADGSKIHEMRSQPPPRYVTPWTWVWFSTNQGALKERSENCCHIVGGAYYYRCEAPIVPGSEGAEAQWRQCRHTVPMPLQEFCDGMGHAGYQKHVYPIEFGMAKQLTTPVAWHGGGMNWSQLTAKNLM